MNSRVFKSRSMNLFEAMNGRNLQRLTSKSTDIDPILNRVRHNTESMKNILILNEKIKTEMPQKQNSVVDKKRLYKIFKLKYPTPEKASADKSQEIRKVRSLQKLDNNPMRKAAYSQKKPTKKKLPSPSRQLKIERTNDLKINIPKQGYLHFRHPLLHPSYMKTENLPTISQKGVMVSTKQGKLELYKLPQYEIFLKRVDKLKEIDFFKNFKTLRCFMKWKNICRSKRFKNIVSEIDNAVEDIYSKNFIKVREVLQNLSNYKFIKVRKNLPVLVDKYPEYLKKGSFEVIKHLNENQFEKINQYLIKPVSEKIIKASAGFNQNYEMGAIEGEKLVKYQQSYYFKISLVKYQKYLKKILMMITESHMQCIQAAGNQIIKKIDANISIFRKTQGQAFIKQLQNLIELGQVKEFKIVDYYQIQIQQILEKITMESDGKLKYTMTTQKMVDLLVRFLQHISHRLSLGTKSKNEESFQQDIIKEVVRSNDNYTLRVLMYQGKLIDNFRRQVSKLFKENINAVEQILAIFEKAVMQVVAFVEENRGKINFQDFFENVQDIKVRIDHIPLTVTVGMFVLDMTNIKAELEGKVDGISLQIKKLIPLNFQKTFDQISNELKEYDDKISLTAWTIQEFVSSHKKKLEFQLYQWHSLPNKLNTMGKLVKTYLRAFPDKNEQVRLCSIKINDTVAKVRSRIQTFDLNCVKKLRKFKNQIQLLNQQIWRNLTLAQSQLLNVSSISGSNEPNYLKQLQTKLPVLQDSINKIGSKIELLNYIQRLQVQNFLQRHQISQFSSYDKIKTDIKLLVKYLNKINEFQISFRKIYGQNIYQVKLQSVLQQLQDNLFQMKHARRSLIAYEELITLTQGEYMKIKFLLETLRTLATLEKQQLEQIEDRKYFNFMQKPIYTVQDIIKMEIHLHFYQIQLVMKRKENKKLCLNLMQEIDQYVENIYLIVDKGSQSEQKESSLFLKLDQYKRYLSQLLQQVKTMQKNPTLADYKYDLAGKEAILSGALSLLQSVSEAQNRYSDLYDFIKRKRNLKQFSDQNKFTLQIDKEWASVVKYFAQKKFVTFLFNYQGSPNQLLEQFTEKINNIVREIQSRIKEFQKQIYLLQVLQDQSVIQIIQNPLLFFYQFFPHVSDVSFVQEECIQITTKYNERINFKYSAEYSLLQLYHQMQTLIKKELNRFVFSYSLSSYLQKKIKIQNIPLQNVYLAEAYNLSALLSSLSIKEAFRALNNQIKHINDFISQNKEISRYDIFLYQILIGARLEYRSKIQSQAYTWVPQAYQITYNSTKNDFFITSFGLSYQLQYNLADSQAISMVFPASQKSYVQILHLFLRGGCGLISNEQLLQSFAARTMTIYRKVIISDRNINNIIKGLFNCNIALFCQTDKAQLTVQKICNCYFEVKNQLLSRENQGKSSTIVGQFSWVRKMTLFLSQQTQKYQLTSFQKILFRPISPITFHWQIIIQVRLSAKNYKLSPAFIEQISDIFQKYDVHLRQYTKHSLDLKRVNNILDKIAGKLTQKSKSFKKIIYDTFYDLFAGINSNEKFLQQLKTIDKQPMTKSTKQKLMVKTQNQQKNPNPFLQQINLFNQFIKESRPILLIGPAASGKTTTYKSCLKQNNWNISNISNNRTINLIVLNLQTLKQITDIFNYKEDILGKLFNRSKPSWIVFQGFFSSQDYIYCENLLSPLSSLTYRNNLRIAKPNIHQIIFQLRSLQNLPPNAIINTNKIKFTDSINKWQYQFNFGLKNFAVIMNIEQKIILNFFQPHQNIFRQIFANFKTSAISWRLLFDQKQIIRNTVLLFCSYGKQEFVIFKMMVFHNDLTLIYILLYFFFQTASFYATPGSQKTLDRVIRETYTKYENSIKEGFINKVIEFDRKRNTVTFLHYKSLEGQKQAQKQLQNNNLFITSPDTTLYLSFLKNLVKNQIHVVVLGQRQSGKTTLMRFFAEKNLKDFIRLSLKQNVSLKKISQRFDAYSYKKTFISVKNLTRQDKQNAHKIFEELSVMVQNVACQETHIGQKYFKYIKQHNFYLSENSIKEIKRLNLILERSRWNQQYLSDNWHLYPISLSFTTQKFQKIFDAVLQNVYIKIELRTNSVLKQKNPVAIIRRYMNILKYCKDNFKQTPRDWTYDFNYSTVVDMFAQIIKTEKGIQSQKDLIEALDDKILNRLNFKLKSSPHFDLFMSKIDLEQTSEIKEIRKQKTCSKAHQARDSSLTFQFESKIADMKQYRKLFIYPEILNNLAKIHKATKQSNLVLINRQKINQFGQFVEMASRICGINMQPITNIKSQRDFQEFIERIRIFEASGDSQCFIYVSLMQILKNPEILFYINQYICQYKTVINNDPGSGVNIQNYGKTFQKELGFIIEYSCDLKNEIIEMYMMNGEILKKAFTVWVQPPSYNSLEIIARSIMARKSKSIEKNEENSLVNIIFKVYKNFQNLKMDQLQKGYFSNHLNFIYFIQTFTEMYFLQKAQLQSKKNAIDSVLGVLSFVFQQYNALKKNLVQLADKKKQCIIMLTNEKAKIEKIQKILSSFQSSKQSKEIEEMKAKINENRKFITEHLQQEKALKSSTSLAFHAINRTEIAQLKYLFNTNLLSYKNFFQAVAVLLDQNTDRDSIRKCMLDINIMAKIKDTKITRKPREVLEKIHQKLLYYQEKEKFSCTRNLYEWMKYGSRLGILKQENSQNLPKKETQIAVLESRIHDLYLQHQIDDLNQQISEHQAKAAEYQEDVYDAQIQSQKIEKLFQHVKKLEDLLNFKEECKSRKTEIEQQFQKVIPKTIQQSIKIHFETFIRASHKIAFQMQSKNMLKKIFQVNQQFMTQPLDFQQQINSKNFIVPNNQLSTSKKQTIAILNKLLNTQNRCILLIDENNYFMQSIQLKNIVKYGRERIDYEIHDAIDGNNNFLIELEDDQWLAQVEQVKQKYDYRANKKLIKWRNNTILSNSQSNVIFIKRSIKQNSQMMNNFRIVFFDFTKEDYQELVANTFIASFKKSNPTYNINQIRKAENTIQDKYMKLIQHICKEGDKFNIKNVGPFQLVIKTINYFEKEKKKILEIKQSIRAEKQLFKAEYYSTYSLIASLFYQGRVFPQIKSLELRYIMSIVLDAWDYMITENQNHHMLCMNYVLTVLHQIVKEKDTFLLLVYIKIFALTSENVSTFQLENLLFEIDGIKALNIKLGVLMGQKPLHQGLTYLKNLPFRDGSLDHFTRITANNKTLTQANFAQKINEMSNISQFKRLLMYKLFQPQQFQHELKDLIQIIKQKNIVKDPIKMMKSLKKGMIFCKCNLSIWKSIIQLNKKTGFSYIDKPQQIEQELELNEIVIVFDKFEPGLTRNQHIEKLRKKKLRSVVLLSSNDLDDKFISCFTYFSFQQLLNVYSCNQNQITDITFKNYIKLIDALYPSNCQIQKWINHYMFRQLHEQYKIANNKSPIDMHIYFQWKCFSWFSRQYGANIENIGKLLQNSNLKQIIAAIQKKKQIDWLSACKKLDGNQGKKFQIKDLNKFYKEFYNKLNQIFVLDEQKQEQNGNSPLTEIVIQKLKRVHKQIIIKIAKIKDIYVIGTGKTCMDYQTLRKYNSSVQNFQYEKFTKNVDKYLKLKKLLKKEIIQQFDLNIIENQVSLFKIFDRSRYRIRDPNVQPKDKNETTLILNNQQLLVKKLSSDQNHTQVIYNGISFYVKLHNYSIKLIILDDEKTVQRLIKYI